MCLTYLLDIKFNPKEPKCKRIILQLIKHKWNNIHYHNIKIYNSNLTDLRKK